MSTVSNSSPIPSSQTSAFIRSRSTTPRNPLSAPIGSWTSATSASRRSLIMSTQRKKSAPMRSILLTKHMRGTWYLFGLAPDGLGLRLDAGDRVEHRDRAVEDAQRPLHLDGEVDVAGRVDDVDPAVAPLAGGGGAGDRDAALLLLDHPVHDRGALVDLADLVGPAGVIEDPLGRRGLARVDVGHDPDVARPREGILPNDRATLPLDLLRFSRHLCFSSLPSGVAPRRAFAPCRRARSGPGRRPGLGAGVPSPSKFGERPSARRCPQRTKVRRRRAARLGAVRETALYQR